VVEPAIDQLHTDAIQGQLQSLRQR
jgi:hypothetical protein